MVWAALPADLDAVLSVDNIFGGGQLTNKDVDLGGLSQVLATVIDGEAVLYGEFQVDAAAIEDWDPEDLQLGGSALSGVVEDWRTDTGDTVTLSAYVYVQTAEHGPLGVTLRQALEALNTARAQYLDWLRSRRAR